MSRGSTKREAMLDRLERYAALRTAGTLPMDAAKGVGISYSAAKAYERWYRRERLGLADRPRSATWERA